MAVTLEIIKEFLPDLVTCHKKNISIRARIATNCVDERFERDKQKAFLWSGFTWRVLRLCVRSEKKNRFHAKAHSSPSKEGKAKRPGTLKNTRPGFI